MNVNDELQRYSSIFGVTVVQFLKDDLNLIEAIFDKASVRPRNIVLVRYEKYFARPHEVFDTYHTLFSAYGRLRRSAYRTRELCFASRAFPPEPHYLDSSRPILDNNSPLGP